MEPVTGDAFGQSLLDYLESGRGWHAVERDDGWLGGNDVAAFFAPPAEWPEGEERLLDHATGRVLDIGAGAGRHALALQDAGHVVLANDVSPGAVEVCRRRGIAEVHHGTVYEVPDAERFDTFLLAGHNLGLLTDPREAVRFLGRLRELARPGARIIGTSRDPASDDRPEHLAYYERNLERGRPAGQFRIRVRYLRLATPWFEYWYQSPDDLAGLAAPLGWGLRTVEPVGTISYGAVLELVDQAGQPAW